MKRTTTTTARKNTTSSTTAKRTTRKKPVNSTAITTTAADVEIRATIRAETRARFLKETGREVLLGCIGNWGMSSADGHDDYLQLIPILSAIETDLTAYSELVSEDDLIDPDTLGRLRDRVRVARLLVQRLDLDGKASEAFRHGVQS